MTADPALPMPVAVEVPSSPLGRPRSGVVQLLDWSMQPGTQQGISLLLAGCMLAWLHPFPAAEGIGATLLAASLPKLWPDNTTDAIRTRSLSNEIAHAAATRRPLDFEQVAVTAADMLAVSTR